VLELADREDLRHRVRGQETHGHGIVAGRRELQAGLFRPVAQQGVGDLDQAAGAVADQRVRPDRAAVVEVQQNLQPATNDVMRFAALNIGHKPYAARIMFVSRVV